MRLSGLLFFCLGFLGSWFALSQTQAQVPLFHEARRTYPQGVWQFDLQTTFYQATANYTKDGGQYNSLGSGYDYHLLDFDMGTRWTPSDFWGIYASTRLSNAESKDAVTTRRNSSLTQVVLGSDFLFRPGSRFDLIPDASLTIPLQRVDPKADEVLNREGALEIQGRLIGRFHWKMLEPFAFAGMTYRDEDRSSLLPYGLGAELKFPNWILGGELRGYQTVIHDKYANDSYQREIAATKNGGALRYDAVDPSLLECNFWMRSQVGKAWAVQFGGGTSITGASTSAGWNLFFDLSYFWKPATEAPQPTHPEEEVHRFQEETNDGVDQNLFRRPAPPPPPPPQPTAQQKKKKLKKDLDQTEYQIELRRKRK